MTSPTSLDRAVIYWSFGWLPSDQLPSVALEALESGIESPSMIALAAADRGPDPDLHRLFEKVLSEAGRSRLTKSDAGRIIARDYAKEICKGTLSPIEGARAIWKVSLECEELHAELGLFGGRVSEYEGLLDGRDRISEMIVCDATELVMKGEA